MNEKAVKELTRKGCIVQKEAAEELEEDDVKRIEALDSPPMIISGTMLETLRQKVPEVSETTEVDTGSGQKLKQRKKVEHSENKQGEKEQLKTDTEETAADVQQDREVENNTEEQQDQVPEERSGNKDTEDNSDAIAEEIARKSSHYAENKTVKIKDKRRQNRVNTKVEVLDRAEISKDEKNVPEFLHNYNDRYDKIKKILMRRMELKSAVSIQRLSHRDKGDEAAVIAMVNDKYSTKSGKWIVEIEDKTGSFKALVEEREGERMVPDEVLGIRGNLGGDIIYANQIIRPDLPIPQGVKTTKQTVKAAYISDLHLGSVDTLHERFNRFGQWLNSKGAEDIGYLVIPGDLVEGVGIYPGQKEELVVNDIYKQYELFEEWVDKLPEDLQIIVGPGNHDVVRLAEPQPQLSEKALPNISTYSNVHLVQNPQWVRLHAIESKGLMNLMYHGYSFDDHVDQIQELREKAYDDPHHVMIDLIKRRHLAPTFGTNLLSPEDQDYLVMERKPDIMVSGHFHSHANESYKGVNVIGSSSFQAQTDFQKRVGHEPDPGKVTVVDFKTRNTKVLQF